MGSRGAQGEVMQEGRPSSAAGGKQGLTAMAKAAALSQLVIFMRQTSPSFHPTTNLAEGGTRGVGTRGTQASLGASREG